MIFVKAENIYLPNENDRLIWSGKRMISNPQYKGRKEILAVCFISDKIELNKFREERPHIFIQAHTYMDCDNYLKGVIDVLEKLALIPNDREVEYIQSHKIPIKKGSPESIYVIIF